MKHKSLNTVILVLAFTGTLSSELQATQEPEAAEPEPVKGLTDEEALDFLLGDEAEAPPQRLGDEVYTIEDLDNLEAEEDLGNLEQLKLGAEQGDAEDQYILGLSYNLGNFGVPKNGQEAVKWLRLAAEQGFDGAADALGFIYATGDGVPQDYQEAVRWYRLAAEQGDTDAQNNLGVQYNNGRGVPQDYQEAVKWYRLAAEQGDARAQYNLGLMYYNGEGVPQDYIQAHKWLNLAASRTTEKAEDYRSARDAVAKKMTASQVAEAQRLAREWQPKTWEQLKGE